MTEKQKRFNELASRSFERGYAVYSEFLGLSELSELNSQHYRVPVALWGGTEDSERVIACFGDREYFENNNDYPIKCLCIEPLNKKFSDDLTHRDFLGSLMGLGIRREVLGDIIINENSGYIFCLDTISDYIIENLDKVRHTSVKVSEVSDLPTSAVPDPEDAEFIVSSERLDVIVSAVYNLSRSKSQELFEKERVFVNGSLKSSSFVPKVDDKISVRGFGRLIYGGILRRTKKGRAVINVKIYGK